MLFLFAFGAQRRGQGAALALGFKGATLWHGDILRNASAFCKHIHRASCFSFCDLDGAATTIAQHFSYI
jgi:hypothetical protein